MGSIYFFVRGKIIQRHTDTIGSPWINNPCMTRIFPLKDWINIINCGLVGRSITNLVYLKRIWYCCGMRRMLLLSFLFFVEGLSSYVDTWIWVCLPL